MFEIQEGYQETTQQEDQEDHEDGGYKGERDAPDEYGPVRPGAVPGPYNGGGKAQHDYSGYRLGYYAQSSKFAGFGRGQEGGHERQERHLDQACLVRAMPALTESQRQVILLRFVQGLSHAETARVLGKTENATKVIQHRALQALRRALEAEGYYHA
jgi:RNA polymerase sigma factor (sigma-70 family)